MSFDISAFRFFLVVAVFWLLVVPYLSKNKNSHRACVAIFTALVGIRYLIWRFVDTVLPFSGTTFENYWVVFVFAIELLAFLEVCIFLLIMSKTNNRSEEADRYQKDLSVFPSVDVFIPTYNEDLDVLEKTITGAKHLDYPDFKVWVLDDGRRDWLEEFCERTGVSYLRRDNNLHAKAGNLNNGLKYASGELFAIFDADFVPARNFLKRTVGFFTHNSDIGIVQTPQHFFNKDPIQSNLYLDKVWPDEQRLFFDSMAPSRDGWNAAFCCGSCSIIRRKAIDLIGGIPTSSITEDLLSTLCLLTVNYRTVYLNEKLSQGMAADSIKGYFIQRSRWCRGGIQCFFVAEGPLRAKGLTLLQRILFAPYGWVIQALTRAVMLIVPVVYLWTAVSPLHFTTTMDIISYQFPMFLAFIIAMEWFVKNKYIPVISTAIGFFGMFRLLPVVISSIVKPFGEPFRVTPKGAGLSTGIDWYIMSMCALTIALTAGGIMVNLVPEYRILSHMQFFPYALLWCSINVIILILCFLICFDTPRKRREERFLINENIVVNGINMCLEDLSLGGCRIRHSENRRVVDSGQKIMLKIPEISKEVEAVVKNSNFSCFMCEFTELNEIQREEMIVKIFTGRYDNEIHERKSLYEVLRSILIRAIGTEMK